MGKRIDVLRHDRGLSIAALAKASGLGLDSVRNVLRGRSQSPRSSTVSTLARALGVTSLVLTGEMPMPPKPGLAVRLPRRRSMLAPPFLDDEQAERDADVECSFDQMNPAPGEGFADVRAIDAREGAGLDDDEDGRPGAGSMLNLWRGRELLRLPLAVIALDGTRSRDVVAAQLSAEGLPAGSWLLIDAAATSPTRSGLYVVWDGRRHDVWRAGRDRSGWSWTDGAGQHASLEGRRVVGRVFAVLPTGVLC